MARLARDPDPAVKPLARALHTTVSGRVRADERVWIERIEARRVQLLGQAAPTSLRGFEAATNGDSTTAAPRATIGVASAFMSLAPSWCVLLMRLVREQAPRSALELGTGFGISGSYQAAALELNGRGRMTTLEGSEAWAEAAVDGFSSLGLERVQAHVGPIDQTLAEVATASAPLDFVFIDAEHQEQATLDHFATVLPCLAEGAIVVLDDADWAPVRSAHDEIARHERISTSIVVGRFGVSFVTGDSRSTR